MTSPLPVSFISCSTWRISALVFFHLSLFVPPFLHFLPLAHIVPHSCVFVPLRSFKHSLFLFWRFSLLSGFLLFDITPFVPVVTGPSLPAGDGCSHNYSDVTQSISQGDKLSFKLLSLFKEEKKRGDQSHAAVRIWRCGHKWNTNNLWTPVNLRCSHDTYTVFAL